LTPARPRPYHARAGQARGDCAAQHKEPDGAMAHQVRILTAYCKGCELCVSVCPKGVLEMSADLAETGVRPARPKPGAECTGCTLCYQVCPDAAIEIWETQEA